MWWKLRLVGLLASLLWGSWAKAQGNFLVAADFSDLAFFESHGVVYKDKEAAADGLQILKNHGINCVRLRLWTSTAAQAVSNPYNYTNNLSYNLPLALRVKTNGLLFSLDFHYSDTWAGPGHQSIPAAWTNLNFTQLVAQMYTYNSNTIYEFATNGSMPDFVQEGNEITSGMLWPYGGPLSGNGGTNWSQLGQLMTAARNGIRDAAAYLGEPMPKIIVHIDRGGDWATTQWYFQNLEAEGVLFDIIGESYYPFYHGPLANLANCLTNAALAFGKPIIVAETGFPWTNSTFTTNIYGYAGSIQGQVSFLVAEGQVLRAVPNGLMTGVFYWGGEYQAVSGVNEAGFNTASFFDNGGNLLPSLDAEVADAFPLTTGPPLATTLPASATTSTNTTLNASGYANGASSSAWFAWGTTTNYGAFTLTNALTVNYLTQAVTASLTNLSPLTTYHYSVVAANADGTNYGADYSVTTGALSSGAGNFTNVYQEDFGAAAAQGVTTLSAVGWSQILHSGGYGGIYTQANAVDVGTGQALPGYVAYFGGNSAGNEFFYITNGAGRGAGGDSAFASIDPALYSNLTFSVETQQSATGANVASYFAVQTGGAWYMSTNKMTAYVETGAGPDFLLASLVYNPAAANWTNFTTSGTSITPGKIAPANLSGLITGIGVVVALAGSGSWDYDNFLVSATFPFMVAAPTNQSSAVGGSASFMAAATGASPLVFQWQFNSTNLPGATNAGLSFTNVQPGSAGPYQVVVSNSYGAITTPVVNLSVTGAPVSFALASEFNPLANGQFLFSLTGLTGQGAVKIEASTNLLQWVPIFTNPSSFGTIAIGDSNTGGLPQRFYRAVSPSAP